MNDLTQLAAALGYAATEGAERISEEVVRAGRIEAEAGIHIAAAGRALLSAGASVGDASETAQALVAPLSSVTDDMAAQAASAGAALAVGQR